MPLRDRFGRVIEYLRVSVTERCNMRCVYCVSPDQRIYEPHGEQLSFEEIAIVVRTLAPHGLRRVRITGGEPLVRPHIPELVGMLAQIPGITDLSLSTNGILLPRYADALKRNGLKRVNISLDTLQPLKFRQISPAGRWEDVWAGIEAALAVGLSPVKLNCVLMKGINDDEILDLARLTLNQPLHVRFIELMPIGNLAFYRQGHMLPISEAKARCAQLGELIPVVQGEAVGGGPAEVFRLPGAQGTHGNQAIFGLPGNPLAVVVGLYLFVRSYLAAQEGETVERSCFLRARLNTPIHKKESRAEFLTAYLRAEPDGTLSITPTPAQGSSLLGALAQANAFLYLPAGESDYPAGTLVRALPIAPMEGYR